MPKRSCDFCVRRKTKCDNGQPCRKCLEAKPPLQCTYLKPVLKRGPKTSKLTRGGGFDEKWISGRDARAVDVVDGPVQPRIPHSLLVPVIEAYKSLVYPVWPVLDAEDLLTRLQTDDREVYTLVVGLCCATMAQLNLAPIAHEGRHITSSTLERECCRMRSTSNYRNELTVDAVPTSFFLHVFHAKADRQNAAMMYLQEAIALARLLRLDEIDLMPGKYIGDESAQDEQAIRNQIIYVLLWVSERGYAMQFGLPVTIRETILLPDFNPDDLDVYGEGLLELARLFASFDGFFQQTRRIRPNSTLLALEDAGEFLLAAHEALESNIPRPSDYNVVQRTDFQVTKQWMRTLLWQQSRSQGLLSELSEAGAMTLLFPSQVAHDLLTYLSTISKSELLPLGRDQLCKSLEITNTLADVILFTSPSETCYSPKRLSPQTNISASSPRTRASPSPLPKRECRRFGPADFLHDLFQAISPLVEDDEKLSAALRHKAAQALIGSANSHLPRACRDIQVPSDRDEQQHAQQRHQRDDEQPDEEGDTLWYVAAEAMYDGGNGSGLYDCGDGVAGDVFESLLQDAGFYDVQSEGVCMADLSIQHPEWFAMVEGGV